MTTSDDDVLSHLWFLIEGAKKTLLKAGAHFFLPHRIAVMTDLETEAFTVYDLENKSAAVAVTVSEEIAKILSGPKPALLTDIDDTFMADPGPFAEVLPVIQDPEGIEVLLARAHASRSSVFTCIALVKRDENGIVKSFGKSYCRKTLFKSLPLAGFGEEAVNKLDILK